MTGGLGAVVTLNVGEGTVKQKAIDAEMLARERPLSGVIGGRHETRVVLEVFWSARALQHRCDRSA